MPRTSFKTVRRLYDVTMTASDVDMNVDGSVTTKTFALQRVSRRAILVDKLRLVIHSTSMDLSTSEVGQFGAATAAYTALSTGLSLGIRRNGRTSVLWPSNITTMADFYTYADRDHVVNIIDGAAAGTDILTVDFDLGGQPISSTDVPVDRIFIDVGDDLSSLAHFRGYCFCTETIL